MGPVYGFAVALVAGFVPSMVKNIAGFGVVVVIATVCTEEYVPGATLKVGADAGGRLIAYVAEATALFE